MNLALTRSLALPIVSPTSPVPPASPVAPTSPVSPTSSVPLTPSVPRLRGGAALRLGPLLLAPAGVSLADHRAVDGEVPTPSLADLLALTGSAQVRGRGGAGFPFAVKLEAAASGRRPVVVVNLAEGEPASWKDSMLAGHAPHRVLDGALIAAHALGAKEIHVVLPGHRPAVAAVMERAVRERTGLTRHGWHTHRADARFVAGQARAVVELLAGRPNLPVTSWQPEAISGHRRRPTLLSNAETFAHVAALVRLGGPRYAALGASGHWGTTLLTLSEFSSPVVVEVPTGTPWREVLAAEALAGPVLTGGYHGTWAAPGQLAALAVEREGMAAAGLALGAGVVIPALGGCPVRMTAAIVRYLAGKSAGRCGPCLNGLPALAGAVDDLAALDRSPQARSEIATLAGLVERRGACAHPDGTARLVRSLIAACPAEVAAHERGECTGGGA